MLSLVLWIAGALLVIAGIAGTVLPALPGPILVLGGFVLAAWAENFTRVGIPAIIILAVLAAIGHGIDLVATALGAKWSGASGAAVIGAGLGTIVGLFFGLVGVLLGPFLGAVLAEFANKRDLVVAGKAGVGAWLGIVIGAAVKVAVVFAMLGVFAAAYLI